MKLLPFLLLVAVCRLPALAQTTETIAAAERKTFGLLREYDLHSIASDNFDVNYYRCIWNVDPAVRFISGSVTSHFRITAPTNNIVFDFTNALPVDSVRFRGSKISFTQAPNNALTLNFPLTLTTGQRDSVSIFYKGVPPNGGAFTQSFHASTNILWTLSEPYGARTWWPCKDNLKDKADSIDILLTCPQAYVSSSNGLPETDIVSGGQRTIFWKHRYPIASYLVAFSITNYNISSATANLPGRNVPVVAYAYPESVSTFTPATGIAKFALEKFSALFTEYPFAKERYAQTQFGAGGGMEHQTNSFIVNAASSLVAHELGHQWFGDKVTCGSWSDLWLNEGFATYMEYLYTELSNPSGRLPLLQSWRSNITSVTDGSVYVRGSDTLNEGRLFSSRLTYRKGGYLVHMLRWKLGDSTFFRGIRRYLNDPQLAYNFALSTDLQRNLETESGQNLSEFFKDWLYGEGYPDYTASWYTGNGTDVEVKLYQVTSHPSVSFYEMPVPLYFSNATRDTIITVNHTQTGQFFKVNPGFVPDAMSIDPLLWILARNKTVERSSTPLAPPGGGTNGNIIFSSNPVRGSLQLQFSPLGSGGVRVELFNSLGQQVYSNIVASTSTQLTINTGHLAAGIYWLRLKANNNSYTVTRQLLVVR